MMNTSTIQDRIYSLKPIVAFAVVFCISYTMPAQNWVPNPGFEETDSCTFGLGLGALHHWYSAYLTPDHLQSCLPYGSANGLPMNIFTYQPPYEGNSCAGILTYDDDTGLELREWLMVPLLDTLIPGQTYYCSLRANAGFGGNSSNQTTWLASSHLGMRFTTYDRQWIWGNPYPAPLNEAHILYPEILNDTVEWTLVSGTFVADSAYTNLMLGNFFSNSLVDTIHLAVLAPNWDVYGYTLVDDVCVSPTPDGCELGQGVEEVGSATPFVFPNPAKDAILIKNAAGSGGVVMDMLGRRVWSDRVHDDQFTVHVGSWARGAYVLQVHGVGSVQIVKFVLAE